MEKLTSSTCLVVLKDSDGYFHFGSDRRAAWSFGKGMTLKKPKSIYRNGILMMGTGSYSTIVLVLEHLKVPKMGKREDAEHYMENKFKPAVVRMFKQKGLMHKEHMKLHEGLGESIILVAAGDSLFELDISSEGISHVMVEDTWALGCGGMYARGSLITTREMEPSMSIVERLRIALIAAAEASPGCDDNLDFITNRPSEDKETKNRKRS